MKPDDPKAWAKKPWSIRIQIVGGGYERHNYEIYSSAQPFLATPDEAQEVLENLRSKIMSIIVATSDNPHPLITYERSAAGQVTLAYSEWDRDMSAYPPRATTARRFRAVVDEVVIPATLLRQHPVRLSLLEEYPAL
jgi:hypothetical protein